MNYPNKIMTTTELIALGFKRKDLYELSRRRGQKFCYQLKKDGKLIWDTDKLQGFLDRL